MTEAELKAKLDEIAKRLSEKQDKKITIKVAPTCPTDPAERALCDSCQ